MSCSRLSKWRHIPVERPEHSIGRYAMIPHQRDPGNPPAPNRSDTGDVIMSAMASQITSLTIVCSNVYSGADQRKHESASLAFVRGIYRWPVNSPHKWPVTRKMFPFDDVMMISTPLFRIQFYFHLYVDGLLQDCSNSSALAMELLQSCAKPSV